MLADTPGHGRLDGGGGRLDELALVLEPGEDHLGGDLLASGVELLGELMNTWFCHFSPVRLTHPRTGVGASRGSSSLGTHRVPIGFLPAFVLDGPAVGAGGAFGAEAACAARCSRTGATSGDPLRRSARPKARRRSARLTQAGSGWIQAPRPGIRARESTTRSPSVDATTRRSCARGAAVRQPTQVRVGSCVVAATKSPSVLSLVGLPRPAAARPSHGHAGARTVRRRGSVYRRRRPALLGQG